MTRRRTELGIIAAGIGLGVAAQLVSFDATDPRRWVLDLLVGWVWIGCGLAVRKRDAYARSGALMIATGCTWFIGNFAAASLPAVAETAELAAYLHRGFLWHLLVAFPTGRPASRVEGVAVVLGYVASVAAPVWDLELVTFVLSGVLLLTCLSAYLVAVGGLRRARLVALCAAAPLALALAGAAAARLGVAVPGVRPPWLVVYEVVLVLIAVTTVAGVRARFWQRADITDLVVELRGAQRPTLRSALARAVGDPALDIGYWLAEPGVFVDANGVQMVLPQDDAERVVTVVPGDDGPVAAIVHDPAVLQDPTLVDAVTAATRLAAANVRLQAEVRTNARELEASRRRILDARDAERTRLEARLEEGALRRLQVVTQQLGAAPHGASDHVARAREQLDRAADELGRLAAGLHPRVLTEEGLPAALRALADGCPVPVRLDVSAPAVPAPLAAAVYFVCAEALANIAKHASASHVRMSVAANGAGVSVVIEDDGVGGADVRRGSGLLGLDDRLAALGGSLRVVSEPGHGTRLVAELPLDDEPPG